MPEATMHENDRVVARQDDIWFTWQVIAMQTEAEPMGVQITPDDELGFGVAAPHLAHDPGALGRREDVRHLSGGGFDGAKDPHRVAAHHLGDVGLGESAPAQPGRQVGQLRDVFHVLGSLLRHAVEVRA